MAVEEQRVYIKIRTLLSCSPTEIKADLDKVYGDQVKVMSQGEGTIWKSCQVSTGLQNHEILISGDPHTDSRTIAFPVRRHRLTKKLLRLAFPGAIGLLYTDRNSQDNDTTSQVPVCKGIFQEPEGGWFTKERRYFVKHKQRPRLDLYCVMMLKRYQALTLGATIYLDHPARRVPEIKVVAAIDLGTSYSGCAYCFKSDVRRIYTHQWKGEGITDSTDKTPTTLLLHPSGEFHSFGYEAEDDYTQLVEGQLHKDWYYFQNIKMQLYEAKGLCRSTMLEDTNGKQKRAIDVVIKIIEYMKKLLLQDVRSREPDIRMTEITWVVTVPPTWSDAGKQFIREAAVKAGIQNGALKLVQDLEAASLYCKSRDPADIQVISGTKTGKPLVPGSKYILIHLGGGKADICAHEILSDNYLMEIYRAPGDGLGGGHMTPDDRLVGGHSTPGDGLPGGYSGLNGLGGGASGLGDGLGGEHKVQGHEQNGVRSILGDAMGEGHRPSGVELDGRHRPSGVGLGGGHMPSGVGLGGRNINDEFTKFMGELLGQDTMDEFYTECRTEYVTFMRDFECKKRLPTTPQSHLVFELASTLVDIMWRRSTMTLEEAVQRSGHAQHITVNANRLMIDGTIIENLYKKTLKSILSYLRQIKNDERLREIRTVVLVGGFSQCTLVQSAIQEEFQDDIVIIPSIPDTAILQGAVMLGHRREVLTVGRMAMFTYGVSFARTPFYEGEDPEELKAYRNGETYCDGVFEKLVEIGQPIKWSDVFTVCRSSHMTSKESKSKFLYAKVYASSQKSPGYCTGDCACVKIGQIAREPPKEGWADVVKSQIEISFGETEIIIQVHDDATGVRYKANLDYV